MIQIAVIRVSEAISQPEVAKIAAALQMQWNEHLAPVWGLEDVGLTVLNNPVVPTSAPPHAWQLVFLDDSDQADALAYHDVTPTGLPISKVFVKTLLADKSSVSVSASHELCEMAVDPTINLMAQGNDGRVRAYEVCDPCEDDSYGYIINGVQVSDFVFPAWFGFPSSNGPYDFMGHCKTSFEVLPGGYAQIFDSTAGWTQVNGAEVKKAKSLYPVAGSRRDRRMRFRRWKFSG